MEPSTACCVRWREYQRKEQTGVFNRTGLTRKRGEFGSCANAKRCVIGFAKTLRGGWTREGANGEHGFDEDNVHESKMQQ